jgi:hypothetical protein
VVFSEPRLFARFGLPSTHPAAGVDRLGRGSRNAAG